MHGHIPLAAPHLHGNERTYLDECIRTNWVSYVGPFVTQFEAEFARLLGLPGALALNSGTAALHLALLVAGVVPGDLVIVPAISFIATANAVRYCGGDPVFIDVAPETWQIDHRKVRDFLLTQCVGTPDGVRHVASRRTVRAVVPAHILGHPVDMDPLREICGQLGLVLIEDAAEALGASYKDRPVGTLGDIACFSFNGNKVITSGGGGMIVATDMRRLGRARHLSTQAKADGGEYIHDAVGYNYRLSNIQAAVGLAQLELLPEHLARKRAIAARYMEGLAGLPGVSLPPTAPWAQSTYWLFTILIDASSSRLGSRELIAALAAEDIEARPLWAPLFEQTPYRDSPRYLIEYAPRLYAQAVSLPSSVGLTAADQDRVIATIRANLAP